MCCSYSYRRQTTFCGGECIVNGPASARTAICEANYRNIDRIQEGIKFCSHTITFLAGTCHRSPEAHLGTSRAKFLRPNVSDPVPTPPQHIDAEADHFADQRPYVGTGASEVMGERGRRVEHYAG